MFVSPSLWPKIGKYVSVSYVNLPTGRFGWLEGYRGRAPYFSTSSFDRSPCKLPHILLFFSVLEPPPTAIAGLLSFLSQSSKSSMDGYPSLEDSLAEEMQEFLMPHSSKSELASLFSAGHQSLYVYTVPSSTRVLTDILPAFFFSLRPPCPRSSSSSASASAAGRI